MDAEGGTIEGQFNEEGQLHGEGQRHYLNGQVEQGSFQEGKLKKGTRLLLR